MCRPSFESSDELCDLVWIMTVMVKLMKVLMVNQRVLNKAWTCQTYWGDACEDGFSTSRAVS